MKALDQHGQQLASVAAERRRREVADEVGRELGGATVTVDGDDVVVTGNHLLRSWLSNASLRHLRRHS